MAAAASLHPHILVVDDDPDIVESVTDLLRMFLPGVRVDQANSGQEALRFLAGDSIDLVVTDFMMPGMNGVQLLREIQRRSPGIPNILVTAFGADVIKGAGQPEPQRILHKPFEVADFQVAVEKALASSV